MLLGPFLSYEENEVLNTAPWSIISRTIELFGSLIFLSPPFSKKDCKNGRKMILRSLVNISATE
jgi:hypothetical protein